METPKRKACDRCHGLKLRCRRLDNEQCERCLKANQTCTSSPSLRYYKKKDWRGRAAKDIKRPLQIRPGPVEDNGAAPPPPRQEKVLCDWMSHSEQAPATSNSFDGPQTDKHIADLPSVHSSGQDFTPYQYQSVFESQDINLTNQGDSERAPKIGLADGAELGYLELCLPFSSLEYNELQNTARSDQVKQTLLGYLSELNLAHDACQALQRDTTCSHANMGDFEVKMVDGTRAALPRLSIKELFQLSQRFSSTLHMMAIQANYWSVDNKEGRVVRA
ncbi:hypothetical protein F5B22DRAFT_656339 [Xylaria bambusicola]|uniref:uncharacterized protein n=1 Tax=Xylaria bambusicola TaxID=326684 RepID=UPI002007C723|nr:uncharacterized protein F5B22DRAFT_656339 [Xylaria bambusicola]KAI0515153.1 hypothetical protein F5B22DRAFT_656339 [Xylaria bambusicola]